MSGLPLNYDPTKHLGDDSRAKNDPRVNFLNGMGDRNSWSTQEFKNTGFSTGGTQSLIMVISSNRNFGITTVTATKGTPASGYTTSTIIYSSAFPENDDLYLYIAGDTLNNEQFTVNYINENPYSNDVCNGNGQSCYVGFPGNPAMGM